MAWLCICICSEHYGLTHHVFFLIYSCGDCFLFFSPPFCSMEMKVNWVLHMLLKCRRYHISGDFRHVFLQKEKLSHKLMWSETITMLELQLCVIWFSSDVRHNKFWQFAKSIWSDIQWFWETRVSKYFMEFLHHKLDKDAWWIFSIIFVIVFQHFEFARY